MRKLKAVGLPIGLSTLLFLLVFAASASAATGGISGRVTAASGGAPIDGIEVCALPFEVGQEETCTKSNSNGEYVLSGLPVGQYFVGFFSPYGGTLNYISQIYENGKAQPVTVTGGSTTIGIDAALQEGGKISGTVTSAAVGNAPIDGIEVCAWPVSEEASAGCSLTNSNGEYEILGLSSAEYAVEFFSPEGSGLNYAIQYYNGKSKASEANNVSVTAGKTTSGIGAEMSQGGGIGGRVTDASTGLPLNEAYVCARQTAGSPEGCAGTNANGEYEILGLPAGDYQVAFLGGAKYAIQYYDEKSKLGEAQLVAVVVGSVTEGIDASLRQESEVLPPPVGTIPLNTTAPSVQGMPSVGSTIMCIEGLWSGNPTPVLSLQWLRDGAPIPGATAPTYDVTSADAGHTLACQVTATNRVGSKSVVSAGLAVPPEPSVPSAGGQAPLLTVSGSRLAVTGKKIKVGLACAKAACKGTVQITLNTIVKVRRGKRLVKRKDTIVLAKGSFSLAAEAHTTIALSLTKAGRSHSKDLKRHPLKCQLLLAPTGGSRTNKQVVLS